MKCRFCATPLEDVFLDLGTSPPSNAYLAPEAAQAPETWFPLKLFTCPRCHLVQVDEVQGHAELFSPDYAYFSSYSRSWLEHARQYVDTAVSRLALDANSLVVELASNDGYLLQYVAAKSIPCLGIEPTAGTAAVAQARGIETLVRFFGRALAEELVGERGHADLIVGNNVLAHVPDINDFVAGFTRLLKPGGVATFEFPHLLNLVAGNQFDTIYHEHFSYLSFTATTTILASAGLDVFDVQSLPTHGGSLRVFAQRMDTGRRLRAAAVQDMLRVEHDAGVTTAAYYAGFQARVEKVKDDLVSFLIAAKQRGELVVGYGAAAKGNTLLNFAGIRPDLLPFVFDKNPSKQGKYLPGCRIPVLPDNELRALRPHYILLLPWNLREELAGQLAYARQWNARFLTAIPGVAVSAA